MQWRTRAGDEVAARLGEPLTKDLNAQALRTALDPAGAWIPSVLAAADTRLTEVRRHVPDAGGLVIATDQDSARAYAELLTQDLRRGADRGAVRREGRVEEDRDVHRLEARWMVAVRMVSEGVDVPRLAVGVYATTTSTPLFFAQAVGRFVRARERGETASVFLPSVPNLLGLRRRDGGRARPRARPPDRRDEATDGRRGRACSPGPRPASRPPTSWLLPFEALGLAGAVRPGALRRRRVRPRRRGDVGSEEEMDFLGIPGLLEPDQVRALLQQRQSDRSQGQGRPASRRGDSRSRSRRTSSSRVLRRELNGLVAAWNHRTGQPHGITHAELRKECGGPAAAVATADQLPRPDHRLREMAATPHVLTYSYDGVTLGLPVSMGMRRFRLERCTAHERAGAIMADPRLAATALTADAPTSTR